MPCAFIIKVADDSRNVIDCVHLVVEHAIDDCVEVPIDVQVLVHAQALVHVRTISIVAAIQMAPFVTTSCEFPVALEIASAENRIIGAYLRRMTTIMANTEVALFPHLIIRGAQ